MGKCKFCGKSAGLFKKVHNDCKLKNKQGLDALEKKLDKFTEDNPCLIKIDELKEIANQSYIPLNKLDEILVNKYVNLLDLFLDDGILTIDEEKILESFQNNLAISQDKLEAKDALSRTLRSAIIRDLMNGDEFKNRLNISGNLPFKYQKNEYLVWLFQNVELFEQRTKTTYKGGSQGLSFKITKGVYYRTSSFKGHPVKTTNIVPIAEGMLALTNKHLYFSSGLKSFRIKYEKIISIDPYSDGIGITKDGVTAKPQIFKNIDGWFIYNYIQNID